MSNLTDLLPAGAGGKQVDFVASGTIGNGVTVALNSDGTVTTVSGVTEGAGTPVVFEAAATEFSSVVYDSNANKIVIAYKDGGNSNYGTAIVGTVSGQSISFGSPVVFNSAGVRMYGANCAAFDPTTNKVVIAFQDIGNNQYGTVIVGTVSGTSISFGSETVFESAETDHISVAIDGSSKVAIGFQDAGNFNYSKVRVGLLSGTTVGSFGSVVTLGSSGDTENTCVYDSNADKIVVSFDDGSSGGISFVGTISGTNISFGTGVVFANGANQIRSAFDSSTNKIVIAYRDAGNSNYGTAIVGTVSGTSISFGTPAVFNSGNSYYIANTYDSNANKIVLAFTNGGNSNYGTLVVGTVSGTSISFGSTSVFESAAIQYSSSAFDSSSNKVVIAYTDQGNSSHGTSVVFQNGATNNTDFIGISDAAISDTASGSVTIKGGISTNVTGLTANQNYYVQSDGSLSTTESDVLAGKALSSTSINLDYTT